VANRSAILASPRAYFQRKYFATTVSNAERQRPRPRRRRHKARIDQNFVDFKEYVWSSSITFWTG
jgi:hypothetical protein